MKKALIIIDVQKYFLNSKSEKIVKRISNYLKHHSSDYSQIYFTIFRNDPRSSLWKIAEWHGCANLPDINLCDELKKYTKGKKLHYKYIYSAFKVSAIRKGINNNNISEVHLCGFDTDCCILATAYDLFDQGIKPVLLEDLSWSTSKDNLHQSAVQIIERNIGFVDSVKK